MKELSDLSIYRFENLSGEVQLIGLFWRRHSQMHMQATFVRFFGRAIQLCLHLFVVSTHSVRGAADLHGRTPLRYPWRKDTIPHRRRGGHKTADRKKCVMAELPRAQSLQVVDEACKEDVERDLFQAVGGGSAKDA